MNTEPETRYFVDLGLPYDAMVSTHVLRLESRRPISHDVIQSLNYAGIVGASFQTLQEYRETRDV